MENWGYIGLFLASFLAGTPIPMNSEVVLSALLLKSWPIVACILVATIGNWAGTMVNYYLGRQCTFEQLIRFTRANPGKLEKVRSYLNGRGTWLALGSGVPIVGNLLIINYGILGTPVKKVAPMMAVGQIVRFSLWAFFTLYVHHIFN